jgi:peptidoglycan-N-acetylglucosamine deacetylase
MFFRACCVFVFMLCCCNAYSAQCNYGEQNSLLSRVIAIDSANGHVYPFSKEEGGASEAVPFELKNKEVILTFDAGPHPAYTGYILDILDHHCVKATFFFSGSAALANPSVVKDASERGHTIAAGSWPLSRRADSSAGSEEEQIEKEFAAVAKASGGPVAPFYRLVPASPPAQEVLDYLRDRGVSLWNTGIESGDGEPGLSASKLANGTLLKIQQEGKGIIQFHDTRKVTVDALDSILTNLKLSGFKIVQIVPVASFTPEKEALAGLPAAPAKPTVATHTSREFIESARRRVFRSEGGARRRVLQRDEEARRRFLRSEQEARRRELRIDAEIRRRVQRSEEEARRRMLRREEARQRLRRRQEEPPH